MKVLENTGLAQPAPSLDALYKEAMQVGEVELGGLRGSHQAEIKFSVDSDRFYIKSHSFPTVEENLAHCIQKARRIAEFAKRGL